MPPLPQIRTPALRELAEQQRYTPRATLLKQVDRAEQLAADIEPAQGYPADWLVFRITGHRPEMTDPAIVAGADALADLSALVERLSDAARMTPEDLAPGALRLDELQQRWGVSVKTIGRWRRRGLIARRVRESPTRSRLAFQARAIEVFERMREAELRQAASFHRLSEDERRRALDAARAGAEAGLSLSAAAQRIAAELGRSHEAIRQLLMREDADAAHPIFERLAPPDARRRAVWERAWRRGVDDRQLARRCGYKLTSVRRAILEQRADLLRSLTLTPRTDTRRKGAPEDPLAHEIVRTDLDYRAPTDLAALVHEMRATPAPVGFVELARARAYHALLARARSAIDALPPQSVSARALDRIETDLRWAGRLKVALARTELRLVIAAAEEAIGGPVESLGARRLARALLDLTGALATAVDTYDPFRGGRLAATAGLLLGRAAARLAPPARAARSGQAARLLTAGAAIPDWTRAAVAWPWLEPDARVRNFLHALDEPDRTLLTLRFGFAGAAPVTLDEAAEAAGLTRIQAPRRERTAIREAILAARAAEGAT
ncbi:MAG: hypothetical protein ACF8R7_11725 [Phycisphaerales bacterium JB039]